MNNRKQKEKILIVDDAPATLNMLREGLENEGYKVHVATTGEKAITRAKQTLPEVILLDVLMPEMDGFETCRRLKADETTREIPVIFMTALSATEKKVTGFKVGGVDYVTKPIDLDEVLARVETHITLHKFMSKLERLVEDRTAELKQNYIRYSLAQKVANVGVWDWNISANDLIWSEQIEPMFGFAPGQFRETHEAFLECVHPEDREFVVDSVNACIDKGQEYNIEHRIVWPDGTIRWVSETGDALRDNNGKAIRMLGIVQDITERRQAQEKLQASEERFRTLVSNIPGIVYRCARDENWTMYFISNFIEELTGYPASEFIHNRVRSYASIIHQDDRAMVFRTVSEALAQRQSYVIEYRVITSDNTVKWVYEKGLGVLDDQNQLLWLDGVIFDITERKQAEEDRDRLLRDLNAKNKELQTIVYISSHDLKTPLINIKGFSRLLNDHCRQIAERISKEVLSDDDKKKIDLLLKEELPGDLNFISSSTDRMAEMIEGLLRVSRIGVSKIQIQKIDMNKLISEVFDILKYPIDAIQTEIIIDPLPDCTSDENLLKQLFSNLINNALKYLDPGRKGRIHISGKVENRDCIYCVEDNGIGIATEHQSKIFELFHRLNPGDTVGGEGLGLTIVSRILDKLSGHISVESELRKGSKFYVSLPRFADRTSSDTLLS